MHKSKGRRTFCTHVGEYFKEYCDASSIHGFRYFGEGRTVFERVWWFIVFCITLTGLAYLIRGVYTKWESSPVIVSFSTRETPIYNIPFPAVTICPEIKASKDLYNHTDIVRKLINKIPFTPEEKKIAGYMSLICDKDPDIKFNMSDKTYSEEFFEVVQNISIDFLISCEYMGEFKNCTDMFSPIMTDEGICYTSNMLDHDKIFQDNVVRKTNFLKNQNTTWTIDDGYSEDAGMEAYPRRALQAGAKNSLKVIFSYYKRDADSICKTALQGYRVILHTPMRIPKPSQQYFRVPPNQVVLGQIQPVMIATSDTVKVYHPKRRECYFPNEKPLEYFKIYTQRNCQMECMTKFILRVCGCVSFYMPRTNETKICGAGSRNCAEDAEQYLQLGNLAKKLEKYKKQDISELYGNNVPECDCLPSCTDLSYDVETSQDGLNWMEYQRSMEIMNNITSPLYDNLTLSALILFFKNTQFVTSQRNELYGPTDFLANFGGLLGLFTGFSILSFMEIVYFLTIRLWCNIRLYGLWTGDEHIN